MAFIVTPNSKIYYEEYGKGSSLVFLHGNNEDMSTFKKILPDFIDNYKLFLVDTPYHGNSVSNVGISYFNFAKELSYAIKKLTDNPIIIGFSDGGIIALLMAIHHLVDIKKLILIGVNYNTYGLKKKCIAEIEKELEMLSEKKLQIAQLMLNEPNIGVKQLANIKIPVLVMQGENDVIKKSHFIKLASTIPNAKMLIIPRANHFIVDNSECINTIKNFIL